MNSITIESTHCRTTLCQLCAQAGTDKTPFNLNGHRHPYTAPYSLFFEPLRHRPIKFAEVGVYRGASVLVWRTFFSQAKIYGYDNDEPNLQFIRTMNLPNTVLQSVDASKSENLVARLQEDTQDGELFDVIIDDASHSVADQCLMIRNALPFLKKGGLLIVEDINRDNPVTDFELALKDIEHLISFHTFIRCDHALRYSPGWDNDKMLVLVRN
jgi:predicted O-methyltransferase YrrM